MDSFFITLAGKKQLTHDVYELIYECEEDIQIAPGQFLLCDTDTTNPKLKRSYSVSYSAWRNIHFIIKALPDGQGGSKAICQQTIGHTMQVWWPLGNFILPISITETVTFIGTGTGFAPLYFQAKSLLENHPDMKVMFIFWVREEKDLFYQEILEEWSKKYPHFSYHFCLSRWKEDNYYIWRVTDYLKNTPDIITTQTIYSICGSPAMVYEVREILSSRFIEKEKIFFEQY